jgi:tRNA pseudouridine55 synthase
MVGILNLNKPPGMTSRRVVDIVTRAAKTKRVGHAGTLDPMATGVLVVCVGWATRLVSYIQDRPKTYSAKFLLGRRSNTDDITGDVVETAGAIVPDRDTVACALNSFAGTIQQIPPQFSAVHVDGKRAYKSARQGEAVEIAPRPVTVYRIELREYAYPELAVEIECGSGTYIRSIGRDLGNLLGCGAVMSALTRTAIGEFKVESALTLPELEAGISANSPWLLPPLQAVAHLPRQHCSTAECLALRQGKAIPGSLESLASGTEVAIVDPAGQLFALAEFATVPPRLKPRQVFPGETTQDAG